MRTKECCLRDLSILQECDLCAKVAVECRFWWTTEAVLESAGRTRRIVHTGHQSRPQVYEALGIDPLYKQLRHKLH